MQFSKTTWKQGLTRPLKSSYMGRPFNNVKTNDTAISDASYGKQEFELDSKFDFLYSIVHFLYDPA